MLTTINTRPSSAAPNLYPPKLPVPIASRNRQKDARPNPATVPARNSGVYLILMALPSLSDQTGERLQSPGRDEKLSIVKPPDFATRVHCVVLSS